MVLMKALVKSKAERGLWLEDVPEPEMGINDVKIRAAHTAGRDLHTNFTRPGLRIGEFGPFKRSSNFL